VVELPIVGGILIIIDVSQEVLTQPAFGVTTLNQLVPAPMHTVLQYLVVFIVPMGVVVVVMAAVVAVVAGIVLRDCLLQSL